MKEMLLKMALPVLLGLVQDMITPENFQKYGKKLLSLLREFVLDTETIVDDAAVLPLLDAAEHALGFDK